MSADGQTMDADRQTDGWMDGCQAYGYTPDPIMSGDKNGLKTQIVIRKKISIFTNCDEKKNQYSRLSLSGLRLSRITAYL